MQILSLTEVPSFLTFHVALNLSAFHFNQAATHASSIPHEDWILLGSPHPFSHAELYVEL
jgi:hypothetical protein